MKFIGIDIGSTSLKAGLLDLASQTVSDVRLQPFPAPISGLPAAWFEVDADVVVARVRRLLGELLSDSGSCRGIVACSQMGGVVLADSSGRAVTNYLSWRDQRSLEACGRGGTWFEELRRRTTDNDWNVIGHELKPGSAVSLLFWLSENSLRPHDATQAMSLGEYVVARLCDAPPKTEPTLALGTFNLDTHTWHRDWFERLEFGNLRWPELSSFDQVAGTYSDGAIRVPCFPVVGDHQAALLGAELGERELSINISTGSQVSLLASTWQSGDYQTRPFFEGQFLNTVTHLPAGRSLNALIDLLCELSRAEGHPVRDPWNVIAREVEQCAATELDVNLAFFASAVGDRGHIANICLEDLSVGSLFRAAFQHMADNYERCADRLSPARAWNRIVLSGGLPQKLPLLRNLIAERFRCPIRIVETPEETLQGLLRLAQHIVKSSNQFS